MTHNTREIEEFGKKWHELGIPNGCLIQMRDYHHQELQKAYKRGVEDEINRESQNMDAVIAGMLQKAREEERERIEAIFKEHVPPHAMDLEDSVWLKRLLNKAFEHENIY